MFVHQITIYIYPHVYPHVYPYIWCNKNHLPKKKINVHISYIVQYTMGVRPCVTAKLPVLRPWFWNLILLNLAAASCYFIASLVGGLRCNASRLLRMCWSSRGLPRRFPCTFQCFVRKVKNADRKHFALAPNPAVLLGFCAPSSVVSVASGWWVGDFSLVLGF